MHTGTRCEGLASFWVTGSGERVAPAGAAGSGAAGRAVRPSLGEGAEQVSTWGRRLQTGLQGQDWGGWEKKRSQKKGLRVEAGGGAESYRASSTASSKETSPLQMTPGRGLSPHSLKAVNSNIKSHFSSPKAPLCPCSTLRNSLSGWHTPW